MAELGRLRLLTGKPAVAVLFLRRAIELKRAAEDRFGEYEALSDLGSAYRALGRHGEAMTCQQKALSMMAEAGFPAGEALVLNDLGVTLTATGQLDEAGDLHRRGLVKAAGINNRLQQARAHDGIGTATATRDQVVAREHWLAALTLYEEMGLPERHTVAAKLADLDGQGQLTHSSVPSVNT
jgi:tetratricopeptide (TPR) repeat protein